MSDDAPAPKMPEGFISKSIGSRIGQRAADLTFLWIGLEIIWHFAQPIATALHLGFSGCGL